MRPALPDPPVGAPRGHIEFVQAQALPWRRIGPGLARADADYKLLSRDPETGACSMLMRYAPGWRRQGDERIDAAEEFYVLEGAFELNGRRYLRDHYAFLPADWPRTSMASPEGCVLLAFFDREPHLREGHVALAPGAKDKAVVQYDAAGSPWDLSLNDPKLAHLGISRKNLRTDPDTGERTFLSLILPHAIPTGEQGPTETHPCAEEAYVISGSLSGPQGVMRPGAYFWRPSGIAHGPFGARWGCVMLVRFVGGPHVNHWSEGQAPWRIDPPYAPILPESYRPFAQEAPPPVRY